MHPCCNAERVHCSLWATYGKSWASTDTSQSNQLHWSRKAARLNPSSLWDLGFLALKHSLTPNLSLSRSEEKTTLSLIKKEVTVFPHSCQSSMTNTLVQDMRSWFNYHLPETIQTSPLPEKCHKAEAESSSSEEEGREIVPTSYIGCSTYGITHWDRAAAQSTTCSLTF